MKGSGYKGNHYMWVSQNENHPSTFLIYKVDEIKPWNQKLGHLNIKSMKKIIYEEAIKGLPKLKIGEGKITGDCQIGKHTKMSHKNLQHLTTYKFIESLHMTLIGPIQVEILGAKIYGFVCVDDFSRYT